MGRRQEELPEEDIDNPAGLLRDILAQRNR
jgi:hypothetical protein